MKTSDWRGLYRDGWRGEITPDAFTHPAKYARGLIRRIYEHAQSEGWARPGDGVVDPFGGVALGGLDAMRLGLHWTGVELEPRFADLGNANIALWNSRYQGRFAKWGTARLLNGDSRNLSEILTGWQTLAVGSPPFGDDEGLASAARPNKLNSERTYGSGGQSYLRAGYGDTEGQLGGLPMRAFDLAVSSPPYMADDKHDHTHDQRDDRRGKRQGRGSFRGQYGKTDGQIAAMPAGSFELAVSSPPYEHRSYEGMSASFAEWREMQGRDNSKPGAQGVVNGYGQAAGQLAGADDFWTAARLIVEQTYAVLAPGAHACWVVKDFVRDGQRVEFSDQWRQLCEAVGFTTLHCHRAWVVEHHGTQKALDGPDKEHRVERKSFFRRLAEKKGSPRIDWETVYCMEKSA